MNLHLDEIESRVSDFQYVDADQGRILLTAGVAASFYFWDAHTPNVRSGLVRCFDAFESAFGAHLNLAFDEDTAEWGPISSAQFIPLVDYLGELDEEDGIEWCLISGDDPDAAADFAVSCMTEPGWEDTYCSVFRFQVPRSIAFEPEGRNVLFELLRLCISELKPFCGSAGLSAITPYDDIEWEPEKFDVATRYRTLYIDSPTIDQTQAPQGIKSVNWLTFISNKLTDRVGGPAPFVDYCRRFAVEPVAVDEGFLLQAGEFPQLGPIELPAPDPYVRINAALRPLRNGNFGAMSSGSVGGERRFDLCTSDFWMRRLDAPDIWPPKSLARLPSVPAGTAPRKKVKLASGELAIQHGRYRQFGFVTPAEFGNEDMAPVVVLLPGDVAPYLLALGPHGTLLSRSRTVWELVAEL